MKREAIVARLEALGFDTSKLTDDLPDAALAEILKHLEDDGAADLAERKPFVSKGIKRLALLGTGAAAGAVLPHTRVGRSLIKRAGLTGKATRAASKIDTGVDRLKKRFKRFHFSERDDALAQLGKLDDATLQGIVDILNADDDQLHATLSEALPERFGASRLFNKTFRKAVARQVKNPKVAATLGAVGGFGLGRLSKRKKHSEQEKTVATFAELDNNATSLKLEAVRASLNDGGTYEDAARKREASRQAWEKRQEESMRQAYLTQDKVKTAIEAARIIYRCSEEEARDYILKGIEPGSMAR